MPNGERDPRVHNALQQVEVQALNFAYRFTRDARVRQEYIRRTAEFSREVRAAHRSGRLTATQAAEAAYQMRNEIMEMARARSSDLGRAAARRLKARAPAFVALVEGYSNRLYRRPFQRLTPTEQSRVMLEIVDAAGRPNPRVNVRVRRLGAAARGLWVLTAAVALYNIASAEDKVDAAAREAVGAGGGFVGGLGGGALAGVWCGPLGVAVGAVVGGVLGAVIADEAYVEIRGPTDAFVADFLPRFTVMFNVDEEGIARALYDECGIEMAKVQAVFAELNRNYNTDADDVARSYLSFVQQRGGSVLNALKLNRPLRELLVTILEEGWTSAVEERQIAYLRSLDAR